MNRRNNPRNGGGFVDGPQHYPENPVIVAIQNAQSGPWSEGQGLEEVKQQYQHERMEFCHRVHKGQVRVNHLENLLDIREKEFGAEYKKSHETIRKQEMIIRDLQESLRVQQDKMIGSQRLNEKTFDKIVARYEAEKQKASDQNKQAMLESLETIRKQETIIWDLQESLRVQQDRMIGSQRLSEKTFDKMVARYEAEKQKASDQNKQATLDSLETIRKQQTVISDLQESLRVQQDRMIGSQRLSEKTFDKMVARYEAEKQKASDQNKQAMLESQNNFKLQSEDQIQMATNTLDLKQIDNLSEKLTETKKQLLKKEGELLENDRAWQTKYNELEEMFRKEVDQKQSCETKLKLMETKVTLMEIQKEELQDKFMKDLAGKEQACETKLKLMETKFKLMEIQKKELQDTFLKDLAGKEQACENKIQDLQATCEMLKAEFQQELLKNEEREVKLQELEDKNKDLAKTNQSYETEVQQVKLENRILEDLCLKWKKKSKFFLFRNNTTEDRETLLEKMKTKMLKEKEKEEQKKCDGDS